MTSLRLGQLVLDIKYYSQAVAVRILIYCRSHTQGYQVLIQLNQEPHLTIKAAENLISFDEKSINTVKTKIMPCSIQDLSYLLTLHKINKIKSKHINNWGILHKLAIVV